MTSTLSELIHGDIRQMKTQEAARRSKGKSMLVLDTEASVSYVTPSHYEAHDLLVEVLRTAEMGLGRGYEGKRKMFQMMEVRRKIEAANPALAAEQRYAGPAPRKFKTATALMNYRAKHREALKRQMHLYWGFYNGRAELWKG